VPLRGVQQLLALRTIPVDVRVIEREIEGSLRPASRVSGQQDRVRDAQRIAHERPGAVGIRCGRGEGATFRAIVCLHRPRWLHGPTQIKEEGTLRTWFASTSPHVASECAGSSAGVPARPLPLAPLNDPGGVYLPTGVADIP
jgi:hypothetical protein